MVDLDIRYQLDLGYSYEIIKKIVGNLMSNMLEPRKK